MGPLMKAVFCLAALYALLVFALGAFRSLPGPERGTNLGNEP